MSETTKVPMAECPHCVQGWLPTEHAGQLPNKCRDCDAWSTPAPTPPDAVREDAKRVLWMALNRLAVGQLRVVGEAVDVKHHDDEGWAAFAERIADALLSRRVTDWTPVEPTPMTAQVATAKREAFEVGFEKCAKLITDLNLLAVPLYPHREKGPHLTAINGVTSREYAAREYPAAPVPPAPEGEREFSVCVWCKAEVEWFSSGDREVAEQKLREHSATCPEHPAVKQLAGGRGE